MLQVDQFLGQLLTEYSGRSGDTDDRHRAQPRDERDDRLARHGECCAHNGPANDQCMPPPKSFERGNETEFFERPLSDGSKVPFGSGAHVR